MAKRRSEFLLAVDIGTSSVRSALFDECGRCQHRTMAQRRYDLVQTADGGAELDSNVVFRATRAVVAATLRERDPRSKILAVGGCGFWHSLLGLNRNGEPITPIWTWADSRAQSDAAKLRERFDERATHARTGCMLRAAFWPAKLTWLKRTRPQLFSRVKLWSSPADWVFNKLFGAFATSHSMASGTGLYHLQSRDWDSELCKAAGVSREQLPKLRNRTNAIIRPGEEVAGFSPIGDGAASNLGSGADSSRAFAINIGTSAAVRTIVPRSLKFRLPFGLFRYVVDDTRDVIGGATSNAGNLRRWCLRELRVSEKQLDATIQGRRDAARSDLDVLPAWVMERAPSWPEHVHGTIAGLRPETRAAEIEIAAACSTFYRLADILELTETVTARANSIVVSGGFLHSPSLVRVLADAIGRDVLVAADREASLRGVTIYILQSLGYEVTSSNSLAVKADRDLAKLHRIRRARQNAFEQLLEGRCK